MKRTKTVKCVYCGTENEIVAKLDPGQTHWQVAQHCPDCGERLRHGPGRSYEPEQAGLEGLEQIELTFHIVCEPEDAMRLALLKPETSRGLSKAVAETLALTGRFHVAPLRIVWTREEEPRSRRRRGTRPILERT